MSVIVEDGVREEFSKPPPKKKWLADYTHESVDDTETALMGSKMMSETRQFVKLLGKQSNEGLRQWKAANTPHKLTLSQNLIGGVVQGVINQFSNFFENDKEGGEAASEEAPESAEPKLSHNEITPVVQSVISQFLNGSLSESGFRRSRKRSHKHVNSRSKDKSSSVSSGTGSVRKSSVIQFSSKSAPSISSPSAIKVRRIETMLKDDSVNNDTEQALNLSCPKSNPKVTFASEDNCFSSDSVHSFQKSKSMQMYREDYSRKLHESLKLISQPEQDDIEEAPLDLAKKPSPVIMTPSLIRQSPTLAPRLFTSSSLPVSRQPSPVREARHDNDTRPHFLDKAIPVSIIKPKPIKPVLEPASATNQMLRDLYSSTKGHSIFSTTGDSFKDSKSKALPNTESEVRQNTREVHNRLEKNRRAHLKSCFNELASECDLDPAKASNLLVIRTAYKCIMGLRREEREQERNLAALVQEKIQRQNRLNELKRQLPGYCSDSESD